MTAIEALNHLKRGNSLACVTPSGTHFEIRSKLSYSLAWYRVFPARAGCLNRYSRLSDEEMLQWLGGITTKPTTAQVRG